MVASFQGGQITRADLEAVIALKTAVQRIGIAQPGGRERMLKDLVDYDLLALEAERRGYGNHPAVVAASRERMAQSLVEGQLTVDPATVPAAEVKAAYEADLALFRNPAMRRARHVLLATEAEAAALIAQLQSEGRNVTTALGKAARERSLDEASKRQSGDLGLFTLEGKRPNGESKVAPEIVKAAFALREPGDLTLKPVRTSGGYSVVLLMLVRPPIDVSLKQAEGELREALAIKATQAATTALAETLSKDRPSITHPERLESIVLDPAPTEGMPQGVPAAPRDPREPPHVKPPDKY